MHTQLASYYWPAYFSSLAFGCPIGQANNTLLAVMYSVLV
jgi:hypothetical protein